MSAASTACAAPARCCWTGSGALLPDAGGAGATAAGHHGRGPGEPTAASSAAAGIPRQARVAVRLLHAGHADDARSNCSPHNSRSDGARGARGDFRQSMPLHGLPGDCRGGAAGRGHGCAPERTGCLMPGTWFGDSVAAHGGPALLTGRGAVRRRHRSARHAACRLRAQPACACRDRAASTRAPPRAMPGVHAVLTLADLVAASRRHAASRSRCRARPTG